MSFPNWPDHAERKYTHVPAALLETIKARAKTTKGITVKAIPMPGSRSTFRVKVKASLHSWAASNELLAEFYRGFSQDDRDSLCLYRDL